jgi:hypothetical protein
MKVLPTSERGTRYGESAVAVQFGRAKARDFH